MRLGIDLGGTKTEIIALDDEGVARFRIRRETPRHDYRATLQCIANLVREAERALGGTGTVGVGMPGAISPATGLIKNANSVWLNGRSFKRDLEVLLNRQIAMANDANCFALSEATDGAAAGAEIVFGVIVGTGTGAGVVVQGRVLNGPNAIAGEWGHNPIPWPSSEEMPGPRCYCGKHACIETFLSGPGMIQDYARVTGEILSSEEIVSRAEKGNARADDCLRRYEDRMARGLAHVINILDPDAIVLGGGMSNLTRLYRNVPRLWGLYVFSDRVDTQLLAPKYGDSSGVRGAAWLAAR